MKNKRDLISYDYLKLFKQPPSDNLAKSVVTGLVDDCILIKAMVKKEMTDEEQFEYIATYISKYSFIIYQFEKVSLFEHCNEIKRLFKGVILEYFTISDEFLDQMMHNSIEIFRKTTN